MSARKVIAVVIGEQTQTGGTDDERRFSDAGFILKMTDPDRPNEIFRGVILPGEIDLSLEVGCVFWGNKSTFNFGAIDINNAAREFDAFASVLMQDRTIEVRVGDPLDDWADWVIEYTGVVDNVEFLGDICRINVASAEALLDRPLNAAVYSTSANASIIGKTVPYGIGAPLNVPALARVPATLHYDIGYDAALVRDNGVALTVTTQWTANGTGFQLLVQPEGRITADMVRTPDSVETTTRSHYIQGFIEVLLEKLGLDGGLYDDTDSPSALGYKYAFHATQPITAANVMNGLAQSIGGFWWFDALGKLRIRQLVAPAGTADLVIPTTWFSLGAAINSPPDLMPGYSDTCLGQRNWHVNGPTEIANSLTSPTLLQIALDLQADYRISKISAASAGSNANEKEKEKNDGARVNGKYPGIGTYLTEAADIQAEATRWGTLRNTARRFYDLPLIAHASVLALQIGQTVEVTAPGTPAPLGLTAKKLVVIGWKRNIRASETILKCWG